MIRYFVLHTVGSGQYLDASQEWFKSTLFAMGGIVFVSTISLEEKLRARCGGAWVGIGIWVSLCVFK